MVFYCVLILYCHQHINDNSMKLPDRFIFAASIFGMSVDVQIQEAITLSCLTASVNKSRCASAKKY